MTKTEIRYLSITNDVIIKCNKNYKYQSRTEKENKILDNFYFSCHPHINLFDPYSNTNLGPWVVAKTKSSPCMCNTSGLAVIKSK